MVDIVDAGGDQGGAHLERRKDAIEGRAVQERVRALRDVGRVQRVVERIVGHVVVLDRTDEGEQDGRRDGERTRYVPILETEREQERKGVGW